MTIEDMEEIVLSCCGVVVWFPKNLMKQKREDGETFYCPNGHSQCFRETTSGKLQKRLDAVNRDFADKEAKLQNLKNGKCPFCWKTVKNLSGHIDRMH